MQNSSRILIVDDSETQRFLLNRLIISLGYEPLQAIDGKSALLQIEQGYPDLILLDIMMPGMNGCEVLNRIKSIPALRDIPVIMISAVEEQDTVVRCIERGAADYLVKPFNATFLKARIHACLENKRLRDKEKQLQGDLAKNYQALQAAVQARDALAHMIVHDLRNPLTIIMGNIQLMQMDAESGDVDAGGLSKQLQQVYGTAEEMASLIAGILDVSRLEDGALPVSLTLWDVTAHLQGFADKLKLLAEGKKLRIVMNQNQEPMVIRSDSGLFSRIVQNLVINALKHAKTSVFVSVERQPGKVMVNVADDGTGVPDQYKEKIFDKFFQIHDGSHKTKYGVGLGLTFCKLAVEALGGQIWVEDRDGGGATFKFTLTEMPG